jgi:hypothetical protein
MGKATLRGYRWGLTTAEVDRDTDLAARVTARFACARGHEFTVQFAADADLPANWNCRQHSVEDCRRIDTTANTPAAAKRKPARTPLVMLHERRSDAELEKTLLADTDRHTPTRRSATRLRDHRRQDLLVPLRHLSHSLGMTTHQ